MKILNILFSRVGIENTTWRAYSHSEKLGRRGAVAYVCDCKRLWLRFPLQAMKYLICLFPRSGNEAKRRVEFGHVTPNVSRMQKLGNRSVLMRDGVP